MCVSRVFVYDVPLPLQGTAGLGLQRSAEGRCGCLACVHSRRCSPVGHQGLRVQGEAAASLVQRFFAFCSCFTTISCTSRCCAVLCCSMLCFALRCLCIVCKSSSLRQDLGGRAVELILRTSLSSEWHRALCLPWSCMACTSSQGPAFVSRCFPLILWEAPLLCSAAVTVCVCRHLRGVLTFRIGKSTPAADV